MAAEVGVEEGSLRSADGTRLHWRAWTTAAPRAALAVAHGLGEHSGRYRRLAGAMNRRGYDCYAVDLRGMGRSEGRRGHVRRWQDWIDDFAAFAGLVEERAGGLEVVPLGHSFGGLVVVSTIIRGALAPSRFVLSNPAFRPAVSVPGWKVTVGRIASQVMPTLALANEVDSRLISRDPDEVAAYGADRLVHDRLSARLYTEWLAASAEALERASEIRAPFLLIVSEEDRLVDPEAAMEFDHRSACGQTTRVYRGRYHEPFNDLGSEEVFADLASWLDHAPVVNGQD